MRPVLILLTKAFADWETGLIAAQGRDWFGMDVRLASPDGGDVTSMGGLTASHLSPFQPQGDEVIVICGGMIWNTDAAPDLTAPLRAAQDRGQPIAAICGGTLALARAGLLDNLGHTSNSLAFLRDNAAGYAGAEHYCTSPRAVTDRGIITAPGTAPTSFAALVLGAAGASAADMQQLQAELAAEYLP